MLEGEGSSFFGALRHNYQIKVSVHYQFQFRSEPYLARFVVPSFTLVLRGGSGGESAVCCAGEKGVTTGGGVGIPGEGEFGVGLTGEAGGGEGKTTDGVAGTRTVSSASKKRNGAGLSITEFESNFDYLRALQNAVKALSTLRNRKTKNKRQQKQNTHAGDHIEEAMKLQHRHMESYNIARLAIIALAGSTTFPPLTEADLFMKSVQQIRHVGDSKRTDGLLFKARALHSEGSHDDDGDIRMGEPEEPDEENEQMVTGMQMDRRRSGPKPKRQGTEVSRPERPEGWLWQLGKLTKISNDEMDTWSNEGDRVQWFRAQAEMQR
ncbi:hypothetical protein FB451DRAFT_1184908 [Mycena latifolia]|nr:hypothetical protein FB451DRAFT_1184908 [Mycena latifolia]